MRAVLEARFGLGGIEPTETIGEYVVLDRLGAGATGVVHRAYHKASDRTVAIKIVHDEVDTTALRERLRRRARVVVQSVNVVPVIEIGVDARVWIVMAYASGRTLRRWCTEARRSWREIVSAYVQVARGLADAHDAGLVHGDVKPEHAIMDDAGRVVIIDFGDVGDAHDDQLALCGALLEALVGEQAEAEHGERAVDLPVALHRVIARGLAADPATRWPSMRALARALGDGTRPGA